MSKIFPSDINFIAWEVEKGPELNTRGLGIGAGHRIRSTPALIVPAPLCERQFQFPNMEFLNLVKNIKC